MSRGGNRGSLLDPTSQFASIAATWQAATAYKAGQLVYNGTSLYKVDANFTSPATFNTTGLTLVGDGAGSGSTVGEFDVRTYGALVDGSTDDRAALLAAMTAAALVNGTVRIPAGTLILSSGVTVPSNVTIKGTGMYTTIVQFATGVANGQQMFTLSTKTKVTICDLRMVAPSGKTALGTVLATSCTDCLVTRCSISTGFGINMLIAGTLATPGYRIGVTNNVFEGSNQSECIEVQDCDYCYIERNIITNFSGSGSTAIVCISNHRDAMYGTRVVGNTITDVVQGILMAGDVDSVVALNVIENCQKGGILTSQGFPGASSPSLRGTMTGNTVKNINLGDVGDYGILVSSSGPWVVADNVVDTTSSTTGIGAYGIYVGCSNGVVSGNHVVNSATWGIYVTGTANAIVGNTILNPSTRAVNACDGIIIAASRNTVIGNTCVDTNGTPRMRIGVFIDSTSTNSIAVGNTGSGAATLFFYDIGTTTKAFGNTGLADQWVRLVGGDTITASGAGVIPLTLRSVGASIQRWVDNGFNVVFDITAAGLPKWSFASNQQTTVGAAGAGSALPATPTKYLKVVDSAGTTLVIPAYAAS